MAPTAAIGIMCKAPQPGRTKTRLATSHRGDRCRRIYPPVSCATSPPPSRRCRSGSDGEAMRVYAPAGAEQVIARPVSADVRPVAASRRRFRASPCLVRRRACWQPVTIASCWSMATAPHCRLLCWRSHRTAAPARRSYGVGTGERWRLLPDRLETAAPHLFTESPGEPTPWRSSTLRTRCRNRPCRCTLLPEWYDIDDT